VGIRPGQPVVARVPGSGPDGWSLITDDNGIEHGLSERAAMATARLGILPSAAGAALGLLSLASSARRRRRAELAGTVRATTAESRALLTSEVVRIAHAVAATHRLRASVTVSEGTPPVVNTRDASLWAVQAVHDILGPAALKPLGTTNMGGEDFAFYLERIPGCFLRIGAREAGGDRIAAHSPRFYPDEEALFVGAAVLAQCARISGSPAAGTH